MIKGLRRTNMSANPSLQCPVAVELEVPAMTEVVQMVFINTHKKDANGAYMCH